jgi:hypothetical protein
MISIYSTDCMIYMMNGIISFSDFMQSFAIYNEST